MWNKILDYFGLRERKPRHFVAWFLVLIFGLFTYLYFEAMDYKIEHGTLLPFFEWDVWFIILTIGLVLFDAFFMFFGIKFFGVKQKWPFMAIGAAALIFASIALFVFPGMAGPDGDYVLETPKRIEYFIATILAFASLYIFVTVIPQVIKDRNYYNLFFVIAIGVGLVCIVYSYIFEGDIYVQLFTDPHPYQVPQSYTGNRNTYAFILVIAMISDAYLLIKKNRVLLWVFFFFFFFNTMFTLSKTSIIMAFAFFSVFVVWRTVLIVNKHPMRALTFFSLMIAAAGAVLIIAFTPFEEGSFMNHPHTFFKYLLEDLPSLNGRSFDSRINCFNQANEALSAGGVTSFFGFGYINWQPALYSHFGGYVAMDVAFSVDLLQFGIPGFVFSAAIWAFAYFNNALLYKHKSIFSGVTLLTLTVLLARCFTEAGDFTFPNLTGTIYYLMVLCPMLTELGSIKDKQTSLEQA